VVDNNRKFVGFADADDVIKLIQENNPDLSSVIQTNVPETSAKTPVKELIDKISTTPIPFAVLDDERRLVGIIVRGAVLGAIAGNEVTDQ